MEEGEEKLKGDFRFFLIILQENDDDDVDTFAWLWFRITVQHKRCRQL